jgi:hypothetical protein
MLNGGGMLQTHIGKGIEQWSSDIEVGEGHFLEKIKDR